MTCREFGAGELDRAPLTQPRRAPADTPVMRDASLPALTAPRLDSVTVQVFPFWKHLRLTLHEDYRRPGRTLWYAVLAGRQVAARRSAEG